jgi:DNA-binding CsgD family transcriptional regulator
MSVPAVAEQLESGYPENTSVQLIRLLLAQLGRADGLRASDLPGPEPSEEILLDVDVDGSRYLLIRMPVMNALRAQLSPREREIVRMVAQGHANKIIADFLGISTWTVCTHLRRIFAKLGVGSRAAMVAKILENPNARRPDTPATHVLNGR